NNESKERQKAMNRKIWKALGIAVCMLALAAPRAMAETYKVGKNAPFIKFGDAVDEINKSGDTKNEIVLMENITLGVNYTLTNDKATTIKTTTIKGEGHTIFVEPNAGITVTGKGNVLNLGAEGYKGTLTIDRDPRDGSVPETRGAFITVSGGATANMYGNVTLQNWQFAGNACVVIMGSESVFNMHGGVIENCSRAVTAGSRTTFNMSGGKIRNREGIRGSGNGGGVRVYEATFVMSGGTISGCTADTGGGLYATNQSTITINNGTISGCTAKEKGGGLYATNQSTITINNGTISECTAEMEEGGGLYADNSAITINKGTISECTAEMEEGGGLYATNQSTININKGTISGCDGRWGGGLYAENSSTITITDSTISGCKAGAGGGLFVTGSTLNIEDDIISECTASDTGKGGGLYAENSTLTISGGTIKGNKAAYGGGVALVKSKVKVEEPITNWTVVDNEAYKTDTGSGYIGGGIYLESGSMDVSNGSNKIYNNTADGHGADICLTDDTSSIKLPNAANMGAKYHDSGINIDGWYKDDNPRYTPSESGQVVDAGVELKGGLSLVASYKASPVRIEIDANGGKGGSVSQTVQKGTNVTLEAPTKEGHLFKGWKDEKGNSYPAGEDGKVKITVTGDMTLTAEWKKLPSAENLPKTGDESPVLLWGAALAVSAAACFVLRRRK
ncbi:MAG: right-handed parallel beta-helix repeat-containing protein, partial [Clostridiales bacterium]|nr:right-handed parallel beta-helix repeat-containing protein [Clostridiales bacterium]